MESPLELDVAVGFGLESVVGGDGEGPNREEEEDDEGEEVEPVVLELMTPRTTVIAADLGSVNVDVNGAMPGDSVVVWKNDVSTCVSEM